MEQVEFVAAVKTGVEIIRGKLRGDEDWLPTAFFLLRDGYEMAGIDNEFMRDGDTKNELVAFLAGHVVKCRARAVIIVTTSWLKWLPPNISKSELERLDRVGLRNDLVKREIVLLCLIEKHSTYIQFAFINRHGQDKPPTLERWEDMSGAESRFVPMITKALQSV